MNPEISIRSFIKHMGIFMTILLLLALVFIGVQIYLIFFNWELYCKLALIMSSVTSAPAACILDKAQHLISR